MGSGAPAPWAHKLCHSSLCTDASPVLLTFSSWHLHVAFLRTAAGPRCSQRPALTYWAPTWARPQGHHLLCDSWSCKAASTLQRRRRRHRGQVVTPQRATPHPRSKMPPPVSSPLSNQRCPLLCFSEASQAKVTEASALPCPKVSLPSPHCWGLTQLVTHLEEAFSAGFLDTPPAPTSWRLCPPPPSSPPVLSSSAHSSQRPLIWNLGPGGHE